MNALGLKGLFKSFLLLYDMNNIEVLILSLIVFTDSALNLYVKKSNHLNYCAFTNMFFKKILDT